MKPKPTHEEESDEHGYFEAYARFAGTLRAWLIAYGIGGPALLLSQEKLVARFVVAPSARTTLLLFLIGVIAQVTAAVLYKTAMWYLYVGERSPAVKVRWTYKASDWISEAYLVETSFDLASIVLFSIATFRLLKILTG